MKSKENRLLEILEFFLCVSRKMACLKHCLSCEWYEWYFKRNMNLEDFLIESLLGKFKHFSIVFSAKQTQFHNKKTQNSTCLKCCWSVALKNGPTWYVNRNLKVEWNKYVYFGKHFVCLKSFDKIIWSSGGGRGRIYINSITNWLTACIE